jgi:hypothetical protein
MNTVIVDKAVLLKKVKENREKHRSLFLAAQEGFRQAVIDELDMMLEKAKKGKRVQMAINIPEPVDHTQDYNRVIDMLEMSLDNRIELSATEFDNYVRDQWSWAYHAATTNKGLSGYSGYSGISGYKGTEGYSSRNWNNYLNSQTD